MNIIKPQLITPEWSDYQLLDSGNYEKLERFGGYVTVRPEPQAVWERSLPAREWESLCGASFRRSARSDERGEWIIKRPLPEPWTVAYRKEELDIRMKLSLTSFKHVGIFPEQADNWTYIYRRVKEMSAQEGRKPQVLNLFAYTGGATLAAAAAGAEPTHVDSVRQVVTWAKENARISGLTGIRWIVDDALKFARRELKRGKIYNGIILDPPAYGRGPDGEKWILEDNINEMLRLCAQLLAPDRSFLVLNLYSMGFSPLLARTAARQLFGPAASEEFGEHYLGDNSGKLLPLSTFYRFCR